MDSRASSRAARARRPKPWTDDGFDDPARTVSLGTGARVALADAAGVTLGWMGGSLGGVGSGVAVAGAVGVGASVGGVVDGSDGEGEELSLGIGRLQMCSSW